MFDAKHTLETLQDAVQRHDRDRVAELVSDRMIWVMPLVDKRTGETERIDASLGPTWQGFQLTIRREVDLGESASFRRWCGSRGNPRPPKTRPPGHR